jgi:nucleotide-binding universal stress UspA family protein
MEHAEARVAVGSVVDRLVACGEEMDASLIVCGSRQLSTPARFVSVSVGSMLASTAARPVAIAPPRL